MQTGDKKTISLNLADVGVKKNVAFIYVEGVGLVADRNVRTRISYNELERHSYVTGKEIATGGERYICRILQCTEWDDCMDYDDSDTVWHWDDVFSWVRSLEYERANASYRVLRGTPDASCLDFNVPTAAESNYGFRPVLQVLNTADLTSDEEVIEVQTIGELSIVLTINISIYQKYKEEKSCLHLPLPATRRRNCPKT